MYFDNFKAKTRKTMVLVWQRPQLLLRHQQQLRLQLLWHLRPLWRQLQLLELRLLPSQRQIWPCSPERGMITDQC